NQNAVTIRVFQGEREMAADNKMLGQFNLEGIPPAPRGVPQIEVTFDIDANGIMHVSAKDKATGKEQNIHITSSSGLSKEEVEKMKKDAQSHAAEDAKKKEEIELRNQADSLVFSTRKQLTDLGDKLDAETKSKLEEGAKGLEEALKANAGIKEKMDELNKVWSDASTKMYEAAKAAGPQAGQQQEAGQQQSQSAPGGETGGKKVENADFEVVDDK
ncbi:MAG: Hsp70 family protein, partial [Bacteroidetes bacterium]|nr:Hsp70 family protein [Bacteroidota bacterium]